MITHYIFIILLIAFKGLDGKPSSVVNEQNQVKSDQSCNACKSLVSFVNRVNTNDSKLLETAFISLCNDYSSLPGRQTTQMCKHMTRDVLNMFKNANKNTFCEEISACDGSESQSMSAKIKDDPTCDFCVTVVTNIKEIISGNPTELEVKYFVEDACHYLGSFENECVSLSDEYIDNLFLFIRQSLQPKKFCKTIGVCNTSLPEQTEKVADISEIINLFPANMPLTPLKASEPIKTDIECVLCKRIVEMVVQELKDNRTEQQIITALESVCQLFPKKDRSKCDAFVEQYANELIHILIEEGDPSLACTLLGVCVPKSVWQTINRPNIEREETNESIKWTEIESPIEVESNKNKLCFECELLMHFIQNEIYDYNNEEQIEEFLEHQLCHRMKIVITEDACNQFIKQYGPQIMQLIAQELFDPSTVCQKELHLCPNTTYSIPTTPTPQLDFQMINGSTEKCELCVSLVKQMDSLLENQEFDKEIAKLIEKSCKPLPRAKRVECELMIEAFAPYFLQTIGHMTDANQICRSIDMCYSRENLHLLGGHKCTFGPTYWCHTIAHAEACKATPYCKIKVWKPIP